MIDLVWLETLDPWQIYAGAMLGLTVGGKAAYWFGHDVLGPRFERVFL